MKLDYTYIYLLAVFLWKAEQTLQQNKSPCDLGISNTRILKLTRLKPHYIAELLTEDGIHYLKSVLNMSILTPQITCKDETVFRTGFHQIETYSKIKGKIEFEEPIVAIYTDPSIFTGYLKVKNQCLQNVSKASSCPTTYYWQPNVNLPAAMFNYSYRNDEFWNYLRDIHIPVRTWVKKLEFRTYGDSFSYDRLKKLQLSRLEELIINGNDWQNIETPLPSLPYLKTLHLKFNDIHTLPDNFLINVPAIETINLSANRVFSFPIARNTTLVTVNLSYNFLPSITKEMAHSLNNIKTVDLGGNAFVCCGINYTIFPGWLSSTLTNVLNLGSHTPFDCYVSGNFSNKRPLSGQQCGCNTGHETDSQIKTENQDLTSPFFISTIVLSVLILIMILMLIYLVVRQASAKDGIKENLVLRGNTKCPRSCAKYTVERDDVSVDK